MCGGIIKVPKQHCTVTLNDNKNVMAKSTSSDKVTSSLGLNLCFISELYKHFSMLGCFVLCSWSWYKRLTLLKYIPFSYNSLSSPNRKMSFKICPQSCWSWVQVVKLIIEPQLGQSFPVGW